MLGDPTFFRHIISFSESFHYTKKQQKKYTCTWKGLIISHTIQKGWNWYMDTGVRDLEVAFFKANST